MNAVRPNFLPFPFALIAFVIPTHAQLSVEWVTQYGSSAADLGRGIAVDALGQSWVTGWTYGDVGGQFMGGTDVFLSRISGSGSVEFTRQRGGPGFDSAESVVLVGNTTVFIGGNTNSNSFDGVANHGSSDGLMVRYDMSGAWQGTTLIGGISSEVIYSLATDSNQVLAAGYTFSSFDGQVPQFGDTLLSKRDSSGSLVWTRFAGTQSSDYAYAAALDSAGNAYFAGETVGSFSGFTNAGHSDILIARYDVYGNRTLLKQFGASGSEYPVDMELDGYGNIYLVGSTWSALGGQTNNGLNDAFLMKLDSEGNVLWTRLFGGSSDDYGSGLGLDGAGHVWIGGSSGSSFGGHTNSGGDAFVAEFDTDGNLLDTIFLASSGGDRITGLTIGPDGAAYVTGDTTGLLGSARAGGRDIFVAKVVPEPCTALLTASGVALLLRRRR